MIIEKTGNIFTTQAQTIVNTINCVGVMGAGIAYEFRLRYPDMFEKYQKFCFDKTMQIGMLWLYKVDTKYILNFPTKYDWKLPSKEQYLKEGLQKFLETYKQKGVTSIAFPILGADRGGISQDRSLAIMKSYLKKCDIDVEIWHFDPTAKDDLFEAFVKKITSLDDVTIKKDTSLRIDMVAKVKSAIKREDINSISGLLRIRGIGEKTLEKLFLYVTKKEEPNLFNIDNISPTKYI